VLDAVLECIEVNGAFELATASHSSPPLVSSRQQIADCRLQIADCRLQIADCRLQIAAKLNEVFKPIRDGVANTQIAATFPLTDLVAALYFCQQQRPAGRGVI